MIILNGMFFNINHNQSIIMEHLSSKKSVNTARGYPHNTFIQIENLV